MQLRPVADESQRMTPHPALLRASTETSATTVGSTLVSATLSRPGPKRLAAMDSGQGSVPAGTRTSAREND